MKQEHQDVLDKVAEGIFNYVFYLKIIEDFFKTEFSKFSKVLNVKVTALSPLINFREALFHYKPMYEAACNNDNDSFIMHHACIIDHLNRGLKDFLVDICFNYFVVILHKIIHTNTPVVKENKVDLRNIYHDLKNIVAKIRIEGQGVHHINSNLDIGKWFKIIIIPIQKFRNLLAIHNSLMLLYERYAPEVVEKMVKRNRM